MLLGSKILKCRYVTTLYTLGGFGVGSILVILKCYAYFEFQWKSLAPHGFSWAYVPLKEIVINTLIQKHLTYFVTTFKSLLLT